MLSRVAERIYWLGRYMERCENIARLVNVNSNLLLDMPRGVRVGWGSLIDITGTDEFFQRDTEQAEERTVVRFMLTDTNNPSSLLSTLSHARENARISREIMPMEAWELINDLYHEIKDNASGMIARRERSRLLHLVIGHVQQFTGLLSGCMSHNDAYNFIRIGRNLERADMSSRIVDAGLMNLLPHLTTGEFNEEALEPYDNVLWMSVLRSLSGYQMYRQNVRDRVNAQDVVTFLLQNENFPRAVAHTLAELNFCLQKLPNSELALSAVVRAQKKLQSANISKLLESGLHEYLDKVQYDIASVHGKIADTWFLPVVIAPEQAQA